jgi:glycosyltransferase involved in cell wall biosynthesis
MACNIPVVAPDVGDVKEIIKGVMGYYLCSSFDEEEIAEKTKIAVTLNKSNGRNRIIELNLDIDSTAKKIITLYNNLLYNN